MSCTHLLVGTKCASFAGVELSHTIRESSMVPGKGHSLLSQQRWKTTTTRMTTTSRAGDSPWRTTIPLFMIPLLERRRKNGVGVVGVTTLVHASRAFGNHSNRFFREWRYPFRSAPHDKEGDAGESGKGSVSLPRFSPSMETSATNAPPTAPPSPSSSFSLSSTTTSSPFSVRWRGTTIRRRPSSSLSSVGSPLQGTEEEEDDDEAMRGERGREGAGKLRETPPMTVVDWVTDPLPPSVRSAFHSSSHRQHHQGGEDHAARESGSIASSSSSWLSSASSRRQATPILQGTERATYLEALRRVQEDEWRTLQKRRLAIQSEEAAAQGSHLPPRMEEAVHVDEDVLQSGLRYHAQLELAWIEDWAKSVEEEEEKARMTTKKNKEKEEKREEKREKKGDAARKSRSAQEHPFPKACGVGSGENTFTTAPEEKHEVERGGECGLPSSSLPSARATRHRVKRALLERVDYRKPLAYITGSHVFYGCPLTCAYPVWCPSEETSMWAYWLVQTHWKPCIEALQKNQRLPPPSPSSSSSSSSCTTVAGSSTRHDISSAGPCGAAFGRRFSADPLHQVSDFFFRFPSSSAHEAAAAANATVALPPLRILDMCCGIGAIGIALAKQWPSHCCVVGVDVDAKAVAFAKRNAQMNGLEVFFFPEEQEGDDHHRRRAKEKEANVEDSSKTSTFLSSAAFPPPDTTNSVIRRYWAIQGDMFAALQGGSNDKGVLLPSLSTPTPPLPTDHTFSSSSSSSSFSVPTREAAVPLSTPSRDREAPLRPSCGRHPPGVASPSAFVLKKVVEGQTTTVHEGGKAEEGTDSVAALIRGLSPAFVGQFDLLVCHPPYLFPREYDTFSIHEQYWKPPLTVLGDPTRIGLQQYRYFKELCEIGPAVLTPRAARHPAMRAMPQIVVEVGRQASLVAELLERQPRGTFASPSDLKSTAGEQEDTTHSPRSPLASPTKMDLQAENDDPSPHTTTTTSSRSPPLPPHRTPYRLSSLFSSFGSPSSPPSEVEKGAWEDVQVHLDAHQLPRWICARATH